MLTYSVKIRPSRNYRGEVGRGAFFLPSSSFAHMIFHLEIEGVFIIANSSLWKDDEESEDVGITLQYNKALISGSEGDGGYKHSYDTYTALPFMVAMRDVCTHTRCFRNSSPPSSTPSCHSEWGWWKKKKRFICLFQSITESPIFIFIFFSLFSLIGLPPISRLPRSPYSRCTNEGERQVRQKV